MRFECNSCNAKYKISDEKVRGRVVRFPCRKCHHKILIDGRQHDADVTVPAGEAYSFEEVTRRSEPMSRFSAHEAATARARRPSSSGRRRSPSVPPRHAPAASRRVSSVPPAANPAAASSAFGHQQHGLTPPLPATPRRALSHATADVPEWHVSINDVPVGPIRLEEMGHKIDAGAVSEYSLVWREGLEDWRPLATVPQLMSLLHERRHSGPPPRSTFSSMPPFVDSGVSLSESSPGASLPSAMPVTSNSLSSAPMVALEEEEEFEPLADALQPEDDFEVGLNAMSQPPAPLGPESPFPASPTLGSYSGLAPTPEQSVSVPSVPPQPAVDSTKASRGLSLGLWVLIVAFVVFSGVAGFLAFERFGDQIMKQLLGWGEPANVAKPAAKRVVTPPPSTEPAAVPTSPEEGEAEASELEESAVGQDPAEEDDEGEGTGDSDANLAVEPPDPKDNTPKMAPARRSKSYVRRKPRPKPAEEEPESQVTAADQKIIDEFETSADAAPAKIAVEPATSSQSSKPTLDSDAVRATVAENKARLQRCYERSIRGQSGLDAVRLDVTVDVAPSGRVKSVSATDDGPGGLAACIEASVRRWRFPASSEGGPAKFPLVFSSN
jgi:predicted Zn finger-like uncharacterized protein